MEKISEEFARELLNNSSIRVYWERARLDGIPTILMHNETIEKWKKKGYIKKSKEEELREELDAPFLFYTKCNSGIEELKKRYDLQKELIKILDKKIEGLK